MEEQELTDEQLAVRRLIQGISHRISMNLIDDYGYCGTTTQEGIAEILSTDREGRSIKITIEVSR